jgi:hypothetical protein
MRSAWGRRGLCAEQFDRGALPGDQDDRRAPSGVRVWRHGAGEEQRAAAQHRAQDGPYDDPHQDPGGASTTLGRPRVDHAVIATQHAGNETVVRSGMSSEDGPVTSRDPSTAGRVMRGLGRARRDVGLPEQVLAFGDTRGPLCRGAVEGGRGGRFASLVQQMRPNGGQAMAAAHPVVLVKGRE